MPPPGCVQKLVLCAFPLSPAGHSPQGVNDGRVYSTPRCLPLVGLSRKATACCLSPQSLNFRTINSCLGWRRSLRLSQTINVDINKIPPYLSNYLLEVSTQVTTCERLPSDPLFLQGYNQNHLSNHQLQFLSLMFLALPQSLQHPRIPPLHPLQ